MNSYLIKNAQVVDSGRVYFSDVLTKNSRIEKVDINIGNVHFAHSEINAEGLTLIPGVIDCHVHFREPGLIHKATIHSESAAAVAGGVTSYLEMPNTIPPTTTIEQLSEKFALAKSSSFANYSFFIGATNSNLAEIIKAENAGACGIKLFMGSSTGNMMVGDSNTIENIFRDSDMVITVHAEDEDIINQNIAEFRKKYNDQIPAFCHSLIRNSEACIKASQRAISLANKYNSRLHLAHLSTKEEASMLSRSSDLPNKKITSEVSVHHLLFDDSSYEDLGNKIKCNPSIKSKEDCQYLMSALVNGNIDIIATDHAPHTLDEKSQPYIQAPSGIPFIQHSLVSMLEFYHKGQISIEKITEKMCNAPAIIYNISNRGFIREGYYADLVLIDLNAPSAVTMDKIYYKCNWSPLEGWMFNSKVAGTFVNGELIFNGEKVLPIVNSMQLQISRK